MMSSEEKNNPLPSSIDTTNANEDNSEDTSDNEQSCPTTDQSLPTEASANDNEEEVISGEAESSSSSLLIQNDQSADELLKEGKELFKNGEIEISVERFSEAVEKKLQELSISESEHHPELGLFYLEYGNSLLKNAENSSELFKIGKGGEPLQQQIAHEQQAAESKSPEGEDRENISDEQLAWEVLELARICYETKLNLLEQSGSLQNPMPNTIEHQTIEDAAFIHLRLGDLLIVEEKFIEASEEFQKALDLLTKFNLPYTYHLSSTIALAQAQLFSGKARESLETFKSALKLATDQLNNVGGATVPSDRLEDFLATREDLTIQIYEVERNIKNGIYDEPNESSCSSSSSLPNGPSLLERTGISEAPAKTVFAASQLKSETGEILLGVVQGKKAKARAAAAAQQQSESNDDRCCASSSSITMEEQEEHDGKSIKKRQRVESDENGDCSSDFTRKLTKFNNNEKQNEELFQNCENDDKSLRKETINEKLKEPMLEGLNIQQ